MKNITNRTLLVVFFVFFAISLSMANTMREQFKPLSIELSNENIAVITCRMVDGNGDCLRLRVVANTPNGYTNSIDLNELMGEGKAINKFAASMAGDGLVVVVYNNQNKMGINSFFISANILSANNNSTKLISINDIITLDIANIDLPSVQSNGTFPVAYSTPTNSFLILIQSITG